MQAARLEASLPIDRKFLRLPDVCRRYGVCRSSVYNMIQYLGLPRGRRLGRRTVVWPVELLEAWEVKRLSESGKFK